MNPRSITLVARKVECLSKTLPKAAVWNLTHTAVTPLDLVKCNMQIDPAKYKSITSGFGVLLKEQGVKGFFKGWVPTLLGYSAQGVCKFGFYEFFKKYYSDLAGPEFAAKYKTLIYLAGSASAEFSGFLLYKELGRRLKKTNPVVAEIFSLMSRDEARHAGFLNKGLSDFNLALDLGFLTKARKYTFFKPKFIFYATYLSEKIGYWRYITIYRHLKENPEYQCYPIFNFFENWCQDENRHGDFFSALMKAQPQFLNDWKAKLWSRFFCLSVYVTMYLNDCQRTAFYEGIGLNTKEFDMHVIIETNRTTARIFPAVLDVENPEFKRKLDRMVEINQKLIAVGESDDIPVVKNLKRIPMVAALASELLAAYLMPPIESGSVDFADFETQLVY